MAKTLHEYYLTNYTHCHVENGFLATREGFAWTSHSVQAISLPVQLLALYLIVAKTPDSMKTIKLPILAVHLFSTLLDIVMCTLLTPFFFYPSFAFFGAGLFGMIGMNAISQLCVFMFAFTGTTISIMNIFENRSRAIPGNPWKIKSQRTRIGIYSFEYVIFMCSCFYLLQTPSPEQQEGFKLRALKLNPCPVPEYFLEATIILFSSQFYINLFLILLAIGITFLLLIILFHSVCCVYYLYCSKSIVLSKQTRQVQRRFFNAIIFNSMAVIITINLTGLTLVGTMAFDKSTQKVTNLLAIILATHGMVESVTLILVHIPYREAARELLFGKPKRTTSEISPYVSIVSANRLHCHMSPLSARNRLS